MRMHKHIHDFALKVQTATRPLLSLAAPLFALTVLLFADPALAQEASGDGAWADAGVDGIGILKSGFVRFGAPAVGLGIIGVGLWACLTFRMPWDKLGYVVLGGILIMAGPTMMSTLMELVKQ